MGVSTNGIIGFGVPCDEGTEFPWDADEFEGDIEAWWRHENGFKDVHQPWTPEGEYAPGWTKGDPRLEEYYAARRVWMNAHPVPVELENYCSAGCPMYAITLPGHGARCHRGYPEKFDPAQFLVREDEITGLKGFMEKYGIEGEGEPRWLLMSYWG